MADDFFGWLDVLQTQNRDTRPLMFEAIDDDINVAIDLITGDSPEILVLSCDCVNMSLRLLSKTMPQFFDPERVEKFIESPAIHANKRKDSKPRKQFNQTLAKITIYLNPNDLNWLQTHYSCLGEGIETAVAQLAKQQKQSITVQINLLSDPLLWSYETNCLYEQQQTNLVLSLLLGFIS